MTAVKILVLIVGGLLVLGACNSDDTHFENRPDGDDSTEGDADQPDDFDPPDGEVDLDGDGFDPGYEDEEYWPPNLSDPGYFEEIFGNGMGLDGDSPDDGDDEPIDSAFSAGVLNFGETVSDWLTSSRAYAPYVFDSLPGARVTLTLEFTDTIADPVLIMYGPRLSNGLWGEAIALNNDFKSDLRAVIADFPIPQYGHYLVLVTSLSGLADTAFNLTLGCRNQCAEPFCPDLACQIYCPEGLLTDPSGCPTCQCARTNAAVCATDSDCAEGQSCFDGYCEGGEPPDCSCENEPYDPVCGSDGVTYANVCEAECSGIDFFESGVCQSVVEGACSFDGDCAVDEVCMDGMCVASVNCGCPDYFDPVCGADGRTYRNRCELDCVSGVAFVSNGVCGDSTDGCGCADVWSPVCGVREDGTFQTFSNECEALCVSAVVAYQGECAEGEYGCSEDADCPSGQQCTFGPGCEPSEYNVSEDCYGICTVSASAVACQSDLDCPEGLACVLINGTGVCENLIAEDCRATGCHGQLCLSYNRATDCQWDPTYACYSLGSCGLRADGSCGWSASSDDFSACFAEIEAEASCVVDRDCQAGQYCAVDVCLPGDCACPNDGPEVCGADAQTYPNVCEALCAEVPPVSLDACAD